MATVTNILAAGNDVDASSFTTAAVTPVAGRLYVLTVANSKSGGGDTPTVSGAGQTWTQIAPTGGTGVANSRRVTSFRCLAASPSTQALTIAFGGVSQTACAWVLDEFDGIDTSGTNGSGAIVQAVNNTALTASSVTATLAAFGDAGNIAYAAYANSTNSGINPDSGYTELADTGVATPTLRIGSSYLIGQDTSVTPATTSGGTADWSLNAFEIKVTAASVTTPPSRLALLGVR